MNEVVAHFLGIVDFSFLMPVRKQTIGLGSVDHGDMIPTIELACPGFGVSLLPIHTIGSG